MMSVKYNKLDKVYKGVDRNEDNIQDNIHKEKIAGEVEME